MAGKRPTSDAADRVGNENEEPENEEESPHNNNNSLAPHTASGGISKDGKRPSFSERRKFSHPLIFLPNGDNDRPTTSNRQPEHRRGGAAGGDRADEGVFRERKLSYPNERGDGMVGRGIRNRSVTYSGMEELSEDESNEAKVIRDAENVVQSFYMASHERELRHEQEGVVGGEGHPSAPTPLIPELYHPPLHPLSPSTRIGHRLAVIGDDFQRRYERDLDEMVGLVIPHIICSPVNAMLTDAYHVFRNVAIRLFRNGEVTWGRILALLTFGYRLGVALFRHGIRGFVASIVGLVVKFLIGERIARWIAQHGGWVGALLYQPGAEFDGGFSNGWYVIAFGAIALIAVGILARYNTQK